MTKQKKNNVLASKIARIERKCDIILSELILIRQKLNPNPNIDSSIERLHRAAKRMRIQCERERDSYRKMFKS